MARITVEDCLEQIPNRFELVLIATKRARQLANGAEPYVPLENDKPSVVSLREIAAGHVSAVILDEAEGPEVPDVAELADAAAEAEAFGFGPPPAMGDNTDGAGGTAGSAGDSAEAGTSPDEAPPAGAEDDEAPDR